jgi:hypothetical protein
LRNVRPSPLFSDVAHTGDVIDGQLAPAKVATVRNWCERYRDALRTDWQRAQLNLHPAGRYDQ